MALSVDKESFCRLLEIETPEDEEHVREVVERIRQIPTFGEMEPAAAAR